VRPPEGAVADDCEAAAAAAAAMRTGAMSRGESLVDHCARGGGGTDGTGTLPAAGVWIDNGARAGAGGDRYERNEALEWEWPEDAVFKAIFGSDDDSDDQTKHCNTK
jgi:hypothetical protein